MVKISREIDRLSIGFFYVRFTLGFSSLARFLSSLPQKFHFTCCKILEYTLNPSENNFLAFIHTRLESNNHKDHF